MSEAAVQGSSRPAAVLAAAAWLGTALLLLVPTAPLLAPLKDWLSWQSTGASCSGLWCPDKLVHLLLFACLTWLSARIWPRDLRGQLRAAVAVVGYSWLLEALQAWSGWREGDLLDGGANTVGVLVGIGIGRWLGWWR